MKELYFVIEDQNGIQYNCDKNLNRISIVDHDNFFYHEYDSCYLITSEEKEVVKKELGDFWDATCEVDEAYEDQDFLEVFMSMYIKDYENWWRERYNSK
jgi:hypothetical protein